MILLSSLLTEMIKFIAGDLPGNFFDNRFINSLLDFFQWLGAVIFAIATLLLVTSVAEKRSAGEFVNINTTIRGFFQAVFLLCFARPLPILLFKLTQDTTFALVATVTKQVINSIPSWNFHSDENWLLQLGKLLLSDLKSIVPQTVVFFILLFFTVTMTIQLLKVFAIMIVQILNGYFSIMDSMVGDGGTFYVWFQDVMANCLTFALQYIFFIAGVAIVNANSFNGLGPCAAGLSLIAGATAVPSALKRLGYNNGGPTVAGSMAALGRTVATIAMVRRR